MSYDTQSWPPSQSEPDELADVLVEFALAARSALNSGIFFDIAGEPQSGTRLVNDAKAAIQAHVDKLVAAKLTEMRDQWAVWLMAPGDKDQCKISEVVAHFDLELAALQPPANQTKDGDE